VSFTLCILDLVDLGAEDFGLIDLALFDFDRFNTKVMAGRQAGESVPFARF
jgi:hypothetical protein